MDNRYSSNTYYLVRHGEAENNVLGILSSRGGRKEYALTREGRADVERTAAFLKSEMPDFVVSSPILRTRETAEIIQRALDIPLSVDERLCETRFGQFEDSPAQRFYDFVAEHGGRERDITEANIEGYMSIRERVRSFLRDTTEHFVNKKIVIVSHGDFLQELYAELLEESLGAEQGERGWYPKKGSCAVISATEPTQFFIPPES